MTLAGSSGPRAGATGATGTVAAAFVLVAGTALAPLAPLGLAASGAIALGVVAGARTLRRSLSALLAAALAVAVTTLPVALTLGGEHAALSFLRALATVAIAVSLFGAVPESEIGPALRSLGVPAAVAAACASALRHAAVLGREGRRLLLARELRGRQGYSDGAALVGALLGRAADRADRVELAMALRGYDPAAAVRRARFTARDLCPLGIALSAVLLVHVAARVKP